MTERLVIARVGHWGDGIADAGGVPIYVPYTLPGETVETEDWPGHGDRRRLVRVADKSPARIAPICPHFTVCGGCAVQHWEEASYRAWKRGLVAGALDRAGIEADVGDLVDAHGAGRRRATFHARAVGRDALAVGFMAAHAHRIVPIDRCPLLSSPLDGALPAAWAVAQALSPLKKPLDIQTTATNGGLDIDVRGSGPLTSDATLALARVAAQHRLARLTRHGDLIVRNRAPTLAIGAATVELPPGAFLQATAEGEAVLAREVLARIKGAKSVVDLFCGVGPFALRIATLARVEAFDSDEPAVAALAKAARAPGLKPVTARKRDLFRQPLVAAEMAKADAVVFDPPRQGAEAQAREIASSKVPVVVAVSCNPTTFARDAGILVGGGYRLAQVTPVDQFRYSAHVEIVATFAR